MSRAISIGASPKTQVSIKDYGATGDGVTSDQTAFNNALAALPAGGGTIYFPIGTYLLPDGAVLHRDNVKLLGENRENSIILNTTGGENGVEISVYRRGGWDTNLDNIVPYTDTVKIGQDKITPQITADLSSFSAGDKIFIAAGGSAQFDQEYGEFNRVKEVTENELILEKNLARDYRTDYATWSATVDTSFTTPALGSTVVIDVNVLVVEGIPGSLKGISIGNELYEYISSNYTEGDPAGVYQWTVENIRSSNDVGVTVDAGTKIFKQRAIIKTPNTYSGTIIENLTVDADGDTVNLSNSMDTVIKDVNLIRRETTGGLWADMDDGRNAKFINCRIEVTNIWDACQPARSFGELSFDNCDFVNAGIDWSEFCFDGSVINSRFYLSNPTDASGTYGISLGWSTTNMRVEGCVMYGDNIGTLIDIEPDINGFRGAYRGGFIIKNNRLHGNNLDRFLRVNQAGTTEVSGNHFFGDSVALFSIDGHEITEGSDGLRNSNDFYINSSFVHVHSNYFAGTIDTLNLARPANVIIEDNWFHWQGARDSVSTNFSNGSIMWNSGGQSYGHIEILKIRNNTFKNWPYADGTVTGPGTPQPSFNFDPYSDSDNGETVRTDITNNLFLDAQQTYIDAGSPLSGLSEFVVDVYPE